MNENSVAFLKFAGVTVLIIGLAVFFAEVFEAGAFVGMLLSSFIVGMFFLVRAIIRSEKDRKRYIANYHITIYNELKKRDMLQMDSPADKGRAVLVAKQLGMLTIDESNIEDYVIRGKKAVEKMEEQKAISDLQKEIEEDRAETYREEADKTKAFLNLRGREKRRYMINAELLSVQKALDEINSIPRTIASSAHKEKEANWATIGGAASALGGPAAGIAAAVDTQKRNEEVRQRNQANQKACNDLAVSAVLATSERRNYLRGKVEKLQKELQDVDMTLVDENAGTDQLMECMHVDKMLSFSPSCGIVSVKLKLKLKKKLFIYESVHAAIDGTMLAKLYLDGIFIGDTLLVLPLKGIFSDERSVSISGSIVVPLEYKEREDYQVSIIPNSLCAIEMMKDASKK